MICPKCGKKYPDNRKFCADDGSPLISEDAIESDASAAEVKPQAAEPKSKEVKQKFTPLEPKFAHHAGVQNAVKPNNVMHSVTAAKDDLKNTTQKISKSVENNKPILKKVIAGVLAVALVSGLFFGVKALFSGFESGPSYLVSSTDGFYYVPNVEKDKALPILEAGPAINRSEKQFSTDGKIAYFYTGEALAGGSGTLYRAELDKLKRNLDKNKKYVDQIDTGVFSNFSVLEDNTVVYCRDERELFYFDGEESQLISRGVTDYSVDGKHVLYRTAGDQDWQGRSKPLYAVDCNHPEDSRLISTESDEIISCEDFDHIILRRFSETDTHSSLLLTNFEGEEKVLIENCSDDFKAYTIADYRENGQEKYYFEVKNEETINPADYINDTTAEADAAIQMPDKNDYQVPSYKYKRITAENLSQADTDMLYTTCVGALDWLPTMSLGGLHYSMQDVVDGDVKLKPGLRDAFAKFVSKHKNEPDADFGLFHVTEEVKKELQDIMSLVPNAGESDWMRLCYELYLDGTECDATKYHEAYMEWNDAQSRNDLRDALSSEEYAHTTSTLYALENGELKTICEDVVNLDDADYQFADKCLVFSSASDLEPHSIDLEELSDVSDVWDRITSQGNAQKYMLTCGTEYTVAEADDMKLRILQDSSISVFPERMVLCHHGDLYEAPIEEGVIGEPVEIVSGVGGVFRDESTLYYLSDLYGNDRNGDPEYGMLYAMSGDGEITQLMDGISVYSKFLIYEDGMIIAAGGKDGGVGLTVYRDSDDGGNMFISDLVDALMVARLDENTLLYCEQNGDLITYDLSEQDSSKAKRTILSEKCYGFYAIDCIKPVNKNKIK